MKSINIIIFLKNKKLTYNYSDIFSQSDKQKLLFDKSICTTKVFNLRESSKG
jgi:hypothetical protein